MWPRRNNDYAKFVQAFVRRYRDELKQVGVISESDMVRLYFDFKGSGKTPDQWFEQQELSWPSTIEVSVNRKVYYVVCDKHYPT